MNEQKKATVKLTSAIAIEGNLLRAGTIVTLSEASAKNLLHRGKAELATAADDPVLTDDQEAALEVEGDPDPAPLKEPAAPTTGKKK